MPILENENEKKSKRRSKRNMYAALAVSIAAVAVCSITARFSTVGKNNTDNTVTVKQVEKVQTDVPVSTQRKTSTTAVKTTQTKAQTQKATINPVANYFILPIGAKVSKNYSDTELQYSSTYLDWRLHPGIDIEASEGTDIHSSGNGTVEQIYDDELYGKTVVINHGNSVKGYYCGVNRPTVKEGEIIEAGTVIGTIGDIPCESVESPHLHFEVKVNEKYKNPIDLLNLE